jgi:hypothetical protein
VLELTSQGNNSVAIGGLAGTAYSGFGKSVALGLQAGQVRTRS